MQKVLSAVETYKSKLLDKKEILVPLLIASILISHLLVSRTLFVAFDQQFYDHSILFYRYPFLSKGIFLGVVCTVIAIIWLFAKKAHISLKIPKPIKAIIGACLGLLTWIFAFSDYNYFFDRWFLVDRVLLVFLAYKNPYCILLFVMQSIVLSKQLSFPDCLIYSFTHKKILVDVLILAWIFILTHFFFKKLDWKYLIFLMLTMIGNWYLQAGIGKVKLNWLEANDLYNILIAASDYGWLQSYPSIVFHNLGEFLYTYNDFLQISTLIIEICLPFLILLSRNSAIFVLFSFVVFHLGVFVVSGIFFWTWMTLELVFIFVLFRHAQFFQRILKRNNFISGAILLVLVGFFFRIFVSAHWTPSFLLHKGFEKLFVHVLR